MANHGDTSWLAAEKEGQNDLYVRTVLQGNRFVRQVKWQSWRWLNDHFLLSCPFISCSELNGQQQQIYQSWSLSHFDVNGDCVFRGWGCLQWSDRNSAALQRQYAVITEVMRKGEKSAVHGFYRMHFYVQYCISLDRKDQNHTTNTTPQIGRNWCFLFVRHGCVMLPKG